MILGQLSLATTWIVFRDKELNDFTLAAFAGPYTASRFDTLSFVRSYKVFVPTYLFSSLKLFLARR